MGRRADHSRDELFKMAVEAATKIVAKQGVRMLSTRRIAARMGYSAGTLYQLFDNRRILCPQEKNGSSRQKKIGNKDVSFYHRTITKSSFLYQKKLSSLQVALLRMLFREHDSSEQLKFFCHLLISSNLLVPNLE